MWRIFDTFGQCEAYCRTSFVAMVRARAAAAIDQELDDWWNLPGKARIPDIPDGQINGSRFPLYGRNASTGAWNRTSGFTTAWAEPRETLDGRWAVQAYDPNDPQGATEPVWLDPRTAGD